MHMVGLFNRKNIHYSKWVYMSTSNKCFLDECKSSCKYTPKHPDPQRKRNESERVWIWRGPDHNLSSASLIGPSLSVQANDPAAWLPLTRYLTDLTTRAQLLHSFFHQHSRRTCGAERPDGNCSLVRALGVEDIVHCKDMGHRARSNEQDTHTHTHTHTHICKI